MNDDAIIAQLTTAFQRLGANAEQARVMAMQLLKRARQMAQGLEHRADIALRGGLAQFGKSGQRLITGARQQGADAVRPAVVVELRADRLQRGFRRADGSHHLTECGRIEIPRNETEGLDAGQ